MSTLIERMILRTRAPLSSLEPMSPVRHATPVPGQQPDETAVTELAAAPAEVPGHGVATVSGPLPGSSEFLPNAGGDDDLRQASLARPPATGSGSIRPAGAHAPAARPGRLAGAEPPESVTDQRTPRDSEWMPAALGWPRENADRPASTIAPVSEATGQTPPAPPVPVTARLRPADLPEQAGAARLAQAAGSPAGEPSRGPDVTVTIEHIEVRAAPAAPPRPARTPFRPQVSLADFLGQDRGPRR